LYLSGGAKSTIATTLSCTLFIIGGIFLLIGFLSPLGSALAGIAAMGNAFLWIAAPSGNLFDGKLALLQMIVMAAAITLLGPGAFSIDAYLFGRREIHLAGSYFRACQKAGCEHVQFWTTDEGGKFGRTMCSKR